MDLKQKIKAAKDIKNEILNIKEWDVKVEVHSMTGAQRAEILNTDVEVDEKKPNENRIMFEKLYPDIIVACVFDPATGKPIFTADDRAWLMEKNCGPIERLAMTGMRLSGLSADALEKAEKN